MRLLLTTTLILGTCIPALADETKDVDLKDFRQRLSYAIGVNIGKQVKQQDLDIDPDILADALRDVLKGEKILMTTEQLQQTFIEDGQRREAAAQKAAKENLAAAEKFLAENAKKDGVQQTKSGLQYKVLRKGSGERPTADHTVKAHYRGTFLNGKEFDSSYEGDEPTSDEPAAEFPLNRVIPGWTEGLQLMEVGSKYRLYVHPKLAYGENGRPGIPPNSLLIFDVELLDTKAGAAPAQLLPQR